MSGNIPTAVDDNYSTLEDNALIVAASGVLANDTDPESDALTAVLVDGPTHGGLTLNPDGSFTYTPAENFNGADSFTYKANDGTGDSNVATVSITVNPINDLPVAANDAFATDEDTPLVIAAPGVLANDIDVDGDALTAILVDGPAHGTLTLNPDGSFTYTPAENFYGADSFTYKANDGTGDSNVATVYITVNPVYDPPVAGNDLFATDEDTPLVVATPGVLANDTNIDGDTLTAILVDGPAHGTLTLNPDGSFTYTPAENFYGADSFTYKANDGTGNSNTATVNITVNHVNHLPVANNDAFATDEDTRLVIAGPG
ncbi:MAG: cadherin-like domain-containing protein, partial [Tepidisphaeraceae bacterium]